MVRRTVLLASLAVMSAGIASGEDNAPDRSTIVARIDELLAARWTSEEIKPSIQTTDSEFMRRAYLDLTGVIPRVSEARAFLADESPDKRAKLIETLLASPRFSTHLANSWRQVMLPGNVDLQELPSVAGVQNWLRRQFAENMRWDRVVADFLVATGGGEAGPALYYTSQELKPEKLAASTARIFLGLQIECAECHAHPFDHWTQEDFWGYAAFFAQLDQSNGMAVPGRTDVTLVDLDRGEVTLPETETVVPPQYPDKTPPTAGAGGTRRMQLAIWMASRDNPYLARTAVNRVWAHMFGRGIVDPVDDFGKHNPASHPELLDELTDHFVRSGFDLQELYRVLANTRAYQLSSKTDNEDLDPALFASMAIKTLTADQLFDSIRRVFMRRTNDTQLPFLANPLFNQQRLAFVSKMQMQGANATEFEAGVLQALTLLNGTEMASITNVDRSGLLASLSAPLFDNEERVESLFLATLARMPTDDERTQFVEYVSVDDEAERQSALSDALWALLNSAEFGLNH